MNKKYIVRKNEEIQKIVKLSKKIISKYFIIYYNVNNYNFNRYCISVSKKIGKANVRNLYKRRVKDIIMKNNIDNSYDYVIILRKPILEISYKEIESELINILKEEM